MSYGLNLRIDQRGTPHTRPFAVNINIPRRVDNHTSIRHHIDATPLFPVPALIRSTIHILSSFSLLRAYLPDMRVINARKSRNA